MKRSAEGAIESYHLAARMNVDVARARGSRQKTTPDVVQYDAHMMQYKYDLADTFIWGFDYNFTNYILPNTNIEFQTSIEFHPSGTLNPKP